MNLFKKQPKTRGYHTIPDALADDDDTAAVPFGTTLLPSTTTTMTKRRMAIVAAGVMLLVVLVGGAVVMMPYGGIMTAAAGPSQCAGDHGSKTPCCNQGGGDVAPQWQCPESMPFCAQYIYGKKYGYCQENDPPQCAGDHGSKTPCCSQGGGNVAPQWQCPESMPFCAQYIYGKKYGCCQENFDGPGDLTRCEITCEENCEYIDGCRTNVNCKRRCREGCKGAKSPHCHGGLS